MNPRALAHAGLTLADVRTAIDKANVNDAKGSFDGPERASTLDANDQLTSATEYGRTIIGYKDGAPLRLEDVATVVEGAENAAWPLMWLGKAEIFAQPSCFRCSDSPEPTSLAWPTACCACCPCCSRPCPATSTCAWSRTVP